MTTTAICTLAQNTRAESITYSHRPAITHLLIVLVSERLVVSPPLKRNSALDSACLKLGLELWNGEQQDFTMACEQSSLFATVASHGGMRLAREELRRLNVTVGPHADDGKLWFSTALGLHALSTLKIPERLCVNVCTVPVPDVWCALRIRQAVPRGGSGDRPKSCPMRSCRMSGTPRAVLARSPPNGGSDCRQDEQLPTPALARCGKEAEGPVGQPHPQL